MISIAKESDLEKIYISFSKPPYNKSFSLFQDYFQKQSQGL
jgi:hypothetical protein